MLRVFLLAFFWWSLVACDRLPKLGPADEGQNKLASAAEDECGFVQNSFGQRVSWKRSLPVRIYLGVNFPVEYEEALKVAAKKWEDVVARTLFVFERIPQALVAGRDGRNILTADPKWGTSDQSLHAVTSLTWVNNQLVEADLRLNTQYFTFYVDQPQSPRDIHLPSLLVHELGHVLGLKHDPIDSVMMATLDYLLKREQPTAEDMAHLRCEYN